MELEQTVEQVLEEQRAKYGAELSDFTLGKMYLFDKMKAGTASSLELVFLSLFLGQITIEQFLNYAEIGIGLKSS